MKLSELFLNRFLCKDSTQDSATPDSIFESSNVIPAEVPAVAAGGSAQDINTGNVTVNATQLTPGVPLPNGLLDVANWGWGQTCVFSSTSATQVDWGAGTFTSASGISYSISAGNTGAMSAKTYIYLDLNVSLTTYRITTTPATAVGTGKVLVAVAQNGATSATYNINQANQIVGDNILANTINATKMNVGQLSAISADLGSITAGTITGTKIQTADTGERVVIDGNGTNNSLVFYDVSENIIIGIGTDVGRAINMNLTSNVSDGIIISSSVSGLGFYYKNTANVAGKGIYVGQTNNGSNNSFPCIEAHHDGHYYAALFEASHESGGLYVGISGNGRGIYINGSSTNKSLEIDHSGAASAMVITSTSTSQTDPAVIFSKAHVNEVVRITSSVNSASRNIGLDFNISNSGSGLECAMSFSGSEWVNAAVSGSQDYKIRVYVDGVVRYIPLYVS